MPVLEAGRPSAIRWEQYPWAGRDVRRKFSSLVQRPGAAELRRLSRRGPASVFDPGCVLFYRDHEPFGGYLLLEGSVTLDLGRGGRPGRGVTVEAPALLGAWHALHRAAYPATARAATRAVVRLVPRVEVPHGEAARPPAAREGVSAEL